MGSQSCGHDRLACKMGSREKGRRGRVGVWELQALSGLGQKRKKEEGGLPACQLVCLETDHNLPTYIHTYIHTHIHGLQHTYIHACMHSCIHTLTYMRKPHPARPKEKVRVRVRDSQQGRILDAEQTNRKHRSTARARAGFPSMPILQMWPSTRSCLSRPASVSPCRR